MSTHATAVLRHITELEAQASRIERLRDHMSASHRRAKPGNAARKSRRGSR